MGRLTKLTDLQLEGVDRCDCTPQNSPKEIREFISYLNSKRVNAKEFFGLKVVVLGEKNAGKSTLVSIVTGKEIRDVHIDVTDWQHKLGIVRKTFYFNIWDFSGSEQQFSINHCFFSKHNIFIAAFDLTRGSKGLQGLKRWLEAISNVDSAAKVIIVGTHLDEIPTQKRDEVEGYLQQAAALVDAHQKRTSRSVLAVGLKGSMENVGAFKDEVYMSAASYKKFDGQLVMGQKVASSYHTLARHMETVKIEVKQGKREPVMKVHEFKAMVKTLNLTDICYDEDVTDASVFLDSVGLLTFYNDHRHNLNLLYFLDPHWLSNLLLTILDKCIPLSNSGIVHTSDILLAFLNSNEVQSQYINQGLVILARNFLVFPLSKDHILLPSMLPVSCPEDLPRICEDDLVSNYSRHILFVPNVSVPREFWGKLLEWAIRSISKLSSNLAKFQSMRLNENGECPTDTDDELNEKFQFDIWQSGLHYSDSEVMFRVEALETERPSRMEKGDGLLIVASPNEEGCRIIQTLVRSVVYIIKTWYPELDDGRLATFAVKVDCPQCLRLNRQDPFQFVVENILRDLRKDRTVLQCGYHMSTTANHIVNISEVLGSFLQQNVLN